MRKAAAPKGPMTCTFAIGEFQGVRAFRLQCGLQGRNWGLPGWILDLRLGFGPHGKGLSF